MTFYFDSLTALSPQGRPPVSSPQKSPRKWYLRAPSEPFLPLQQHIPCKIPSPKSRSGESQGTCLGASEGSCRPHTSPGRKSGTPQCTLTGRNTQRHMTSPGRTTISEPSSLCFSKECSGKESPAQCLLAGHLRLHTGSP